MALGDRLEYFVTNNFQVIIDILTEIGTTQISESLLSMIIQVLLEWWFRLPIKCIMLMSH